MVQVVSLDHVAGDIYTEYLDKSEFRRTATDLRDGSCKHFFFFLRGSLGKMIHKFNINVK